MSDLLTWLSSLNRGKPERGTYYRKYYCNDRTKVPIAAIKDNFSRHR